MDDLWEIELTRDKWVPVDAAMRAAIADAVNSTSNSGQFEARGFSYEVDLNAMVQRNKSTQRTRPIRRKQSAAAQEHEAPPPVAATAPPPATAEEREASPPAAARKRARVAADSLSTPPAAAAAASSAGASPGATPDSPEGIAPSSDNDHLASIFEQMGAIKKLQKDTFRATAYQKAAAALRAHPSAVVSGKEARGIAGIGKGMAERIDKALEPPARAGGVKCVPPQPMREQVLESGHLPELEELKRDTDVVALRELQLVHGVGAVRAGALIGQGVRAFDGLQQLRGLRGPFLHFSCRHPDARRLARRRRGRERVARPRAAHRPAARGGVPAEDPSRRGEAARGGAPVCAGRVAACDAARRVRFVPQGQGDLGRHRRARHSDRRRHASVAPRTLVQPPRRVPKCGDRAA